MEIETALTMTAKDDWHLDESMVAGFLDRDLDPETHDRVTAHLDACAECRAELLSIRRLVESAPASAPRERRWGYAGRWAAVGSVLAASLVGVMTFRQNPGNETLDATARARAVPEGTASIDVVSPARAARAADIVFTWRSSAVDVYRFILMSDDGAVLFTTKTTDTSVVWPRTVRAVGGASYFWRVDGVTGTITSSTGAQRLRLEP